MEQILFNFLLLQAPSWEMAIVWMQLYHTAIICFMSSFAGAIASYPFIDKTMNAKLWQYTFTSWSTGFALSYLVADTTKMGVALTIAESFITGLGGFYAARQAFNRNKNKPLDGKSVFTNSTDPKPDDTTQP